MTLKKEKMDIYEIKGIKDFNLDHIFDCGQCFRWEKEADGSYTGTAHGKMVNMSFDEEAECLTIENCSAGDFDEIWSRYLNLECDYGSIKAFLAQSDSVLAEAIKYGQGIRILKQDLWETMVSFIISQNNNIPRIKGCIEKLCRGFGECAGTYRGKEYYNIPSVEKLASLTAEDLAECRLGYRAAYLVKCAQQVIDYGGIAKLENDLEEAENGAEVLQQFTGIGPKVASCIALFGAAKHDAFPIDVWVKRVMNRMYGIDEKNVKEMAEYASAHFQEYGGIAQQYLFYYIRIMENV